MALSKTQLETALIERNVALQDALRKIDVATHAINLLVNDSIRWEFSFEGKEPTQKHAFGFSVAMHVPVDQPMRPFSPTAEENIKIVFWKTSWSYPKDHYYISATEYEEFKGLPIKLQKEGQVEMGDLARKALDRDMDGIFQEMIDAWDGLQRREQVQ